MSNPVNIKTLAKQLNLSAGTVSKALKDSHEISSETKQKVLALAKELNYIPNPYASSLRKRVSKTIAVVLPEVTDSFFAQAINGIESVSKEKGYHVLIYLTHELLEREQKILEDFQSGRVDGILMSVSQHTNSGKHIQQIISSGTPVIFFDRICRDVTTAKIVTNDFESSCQATEILIEKGCKKIAFLSLAGELDIVNERRNGYKKALENKGFKNEQQLSLVLLNDDKKAKQQISRFIKSKKPDGIIASVEKLATLVYTVCNEMKINIPAEIKIIAFSNLPIADILNPSLTTITQPAFEMGKTAATLLFKALQKSNVKLEEEIVIPSVLMERGSTNKH